MVLKTEHNLLSPEEEMAIFLEASADLDWSVACETGFDATNPNTGFLLSIRRKEVVEVEFPDLKTTFVYELCVLTNPQADLGARVRTNVRTGDYNRECDNLLAVLFRKAQQKAQIKLLSGDVTVSTG